MYFIGNGKYEGCCNAWVTNKIAVSVRDRSETPAAALDF